MYVTQQCNVCAGITWKDPVTMAVPNPNSKGALPLSKLPMSAHCCILDLVKYMDLAADQSSHPMFVKVATLPTNPIVYRLFIPSDFGAANLDAQFK